MLPAITSQGHQRVMCVYVDTLFFASCEDIILVFETLRQLCLSRLSVIESFSSPEYIHYSTFSPARVHYLTINYSIAEAKMHQSLDLVGKPFFDK